MDIIVLIKQVPNTTEVKLDPKTGNLIREGLESIINPDDLHALEAAIGLKETVGGKITVLSMGPPQAIDAVSEALAMGADKGILLSDAVFAGADTWATSYTLGRAVKKIRKYDLIICGRQAIDGDTAQIGPQVADWLGLPQVSYVCEIEALKKKSIIVHRRLEDGYERVQCTLPTLLTVIGELNTPRYPDMGRLIWACREKADVGLEGSLTHVIRTFAPKFERQGEILEGSTTETVQALIERLKNSEGATACKAFASTCKI
jgi:electron transfer flavoprotein beta subunit